MTADLNFSIIAGGGGSNPPANVDNFNVSFAAARPNNTYYVTASTGGVAAIFGIDITSRSTTGFTVQLTAPLASNDVIEFHVFDPANTTVGLLTTTLLTFVGTANFTTGALTNFIRLRLVGGGGAGASAVPDNVNVYAGGGGGAGGYTERRIGVSPSTPYSYTIGAGGTGAHGGGANGNQTKFIVGATTITANGGLGAPGAGGLQGTNYAFVGGAGGTVGSNGDVMASGAPGSMGIAFWNIITVSGNGGSGPFGGGGVGVASSFGSATGNAGTGYGSGGGGADIGGNVLTNGGSGAQGLIVVEEYS